MVRLICPNLKCRTILCAPDHARGKMVRCSACSMKVHIPASRNEQTPSGSASEDAKSSTGK